MTETLPLIEGKFRLNNGSIITDLWYGPISSAVLEDEIKEVGRIYSSPVVECEFVLQDQEDEAEPGDWPIDIAGRIDYEADEIAALNRK